MRNKNALLIIEAKDECNQIDKKYWNKKEKITKSYSKIFYSIS